MDRVYSSPLRRARETADIIGLRLGLPVVVDDRLRERANWGDLPGQTFEEFVEMWDRCTRDREYEPLIGDSAKQAGARLESFALDLGRDGRSGSVVAVGHGGLITDFLTNVIVAEELERWHPRFAEVHGQLVAECSITRIECAEDRYGLTKLADVSHL